MHTTATITVAAILFGLRWRFPAHGELTHSSQAEAAHFACHQKATVGWQPIPFTPWWRGIWKEKGVWRSMETWSTLPMSLWIKQQAQEECENHMNGSATERQLLFMGNVNQLPLHCQNSRRESHQLATTSIFFIYCKVTLGRQWYLLTWPMMELLPSSGSDYQWSSSGQL